MIDFEQVNVDCPLAKVAIKFFKVAINNQTLTF